MVKAGPQALAIVSLIGFLIGLILAFIGAIPLKWFGAEIYIASLIGIGILRLMGAVMTGVVMAGRTGAAYAAELGSMQVNEEIDALESMGIPPMEFLVLPRFLALTAMLPLLGLFGDLVGILGGMVVGVYYLDLTYTQFWQQLMQTTRLSDLFVGLFTCWVFGMLIAICGCLRGLQCGRSSEAVGGHHLGRRQQHCLHGHCHCGNHSGDRSPENITPALSGSPERPCVFHNLHFRQSLS